MKKLEQQSLFHRKNAEAQLAREAEEESLTKARETEMRLDAERRKAIDKEDKENLKREEARQRDIDEADKDRQEQAATDEAGQQPTQAITIAEAATAADGRGHQEETVEQADQRRLRMTKEAMDEAQRMKKSSRVERERGNSTRTGRRRS